MIKLWWERKNTGAYLRYVRRKQGVNVTPPDYNQWWPDENHEPDLEGLCGGMAADMATMEGVGACIPTIQHFYGKRGTPMTLAYYLGGRVRFQSDTVWAGPVIDNWADFELEYDPDNIWWRRSLMLLELSLQKSQGRCLTALPDFGDTLTVFSLLRGTENLLIDLMEDKGAVLEARDKFLALWPKYHQACWDVYRRYLPGDTSWLTWAPGKTYACQCDFSVMISPALFEEFVVPEVEALGRYLEYIAWHLDGPGELKHLDILLDLPQIKAIQWYQGAGQPGAAHWLDVLKKIKNKGKSLIVYAGNDEEVNWYLKELNPQGLMIVPMHLNIA